MKKHLIWGAAALLAVLVAPGCKKDNTTTTPGLSGLSISTTTPFVPVDATVTFKANVGGLYTSDDSTPGAVGLYWQVDGGDRDTLTVDITKSNPVFTLTGIEAGTHTVTCSAFADNYYNGTATATFQAIDPETAITGTDAQSQVTIGGHSYAVTRLGGMLWMAQNLYGDGLSYKDAPVLDSIFGNYYSWEEATVACPDGWRLPTGAEFDQLGPEAGALMVNASFMDEEMWTYWPSVKITNELYFNALPTGYLDTTSEDYRDRGLGDYAAWWTSDREGELAAYRYIFEENPVVQKGQGNTLSLALNVRCVKVE